MSWSWAAGRRLVVAECRRVLPFLRGNLGFFAGLGGDWGGRADEVMVGGAGGLGWARHEGGDVAGGSQAGRRKGLVVSTRNHGRPIR